MAYNWWHRAWWTAEGYQRRRYENFWWDDQNWRWRNDWKDWKYEEQWSVKRWDDSTSKLENERVQMEFRTFMRPPMVVPVPLRANHRELSPEIDKPFWPLIHSMVSAGQEVYHYDMSKDSSFLELFIWCYVFTSWLFFSFFYRPIALWTDG